jgi:hypothetical protein
MRARGDGRWLSFFRPQTEEVNDSRAGKEQRERRLSTADQLRGVSFVDIETRTEDEFEMTSYLHFISLYQNIDSSAARSLCIIDFELNL